MGGDEFKAVEKNLGDESNSIDTYMETVAMKRT